MTPSERSRNDKPIGIVDHPSFDLHRARGDHPERPERLLAARRGLHSVLATRRRLSLDVMPASREELSRVHLGSYLESLDGALTGGWGHLDPDTFFCPETKEAAWLAAGGAAELCRALIDGRIDSGIALLRPPGHHAEPDRAMGFCMLNNIAVAAASGLAHGSRRVAIVDWDVHHGNGTQAAFYDDPRVLFISLHQSPFYPGTGSPTEIGGGEGAGCTINVALPARSGPRTYAHAFDRVVLPLLRAAAPDVILVSAGFDAHARDPLANMQLDAASYQAMASALMSFDVPTGFVLEGGYDLQALESSVAAVARVMCGERLAWQTEEALSPQQARAIETTVDALRPYWDLT